MDAINAAALVHPIPDIDVGIDRVVLSTARYLSTGEILTPDSFPLLPGCSAPTHGFTRQSNVYLRCVQYRGRDLHVTVLYDPNEPFRPAMRVALRAADGTLLADLSEVQNVAAALEKQFHVYFKVAEIEITVDLWSSLVDMITLRRILHVPRTRNAWAWADTRYWDRGNSRRQVRLYHHTERQEPVSRIELIVRRDALRAMKIKNLADVPRQPLVDYAIRQLQFLHYVPIIRHRDCSAQELIKYLGVTAVMLTMPERDRRRLRRRLQPHPLQEVVHDRLRQLGRVLASDSIKRTSPLSHIATSGSASNRKPDYGRHLRDDPDADEGTMSPLMQG